MAQDYERIGRFIYSFHRICGSVEALTETALAENAPRELKVRAARLAQKFKHILENAASTADSEIEATLNDASEVQMEIKKWQSV
ncbi:hypothetical protein [Duganella sp. Root1480D1]|uniref:hypothetical protein n=1 Tax=Duganella sp. Root1480D1 TaxID=1736471 RepID=UPI00070F03C4|nr:hypothetical protein [Duganella sp. Root1480D1]KQZ44949.1 hypothetical protein ASD58_01470 [Duganella sp. Root1480D1]